MTSWNPRRGCKRCSDGCKYCYIHAGDKKRKIDTSNIILTKDFDKPIRKCKNGNYKMKSSLVYVCFQSDFLIDEMDPYRNEVWKMIKERSDCMFLFLTKRIQRFEQCIPEDWSDGYENVIVGCTIENQKNADFKLSIFKDLKIKHKYIIAQPLLEQINIEKYLENIECVIAGGESNKNARLLDYDWVLNLREQCIEKNVSFTFRQCGTYTKKDGKLYSIPTNLLTKQAKKANINYVAK